MTINPLRKGAESSQPTGAMVGVEGAVNVSLVGLSWMLPGYVVVKMSPSKEVAGVEVAGPPGSTQG